MLRAFMALVLVGAVAPAQAADLPFVNWENHPVHALDLSPNHKLLAVAHTADGRVQLFDVSTGEAVAVGHVAVGIDPVSVRFRSDDELWVVNHISDSISVVDVPHRRVKATLATADEPFDVVFASARAFVSCSQANRLQVFDPSDLARAAANVPIDAEDPRALAVSPDGRTVYAAIFESGNGTTLLAGGLVDNTAGLPNVVSDPRGPYGGQNPPPNAGASFDPPINPAARPPAVGLIVRKGEDNHWRDDNNGDWTAFVSGNMAGASGRPLGWDLPDRDLAIVDAASLSVRYVSGLMNIGMALAVNPASGEIVMVGTEAHNEIRFEPKVDGTFVRVHLARVSAGPASTKSIVDLNPQLDYGRSSVVQSIRDRAVGDPRAVIFSSDGHRGWVAGLGSNNVVMIDAQGTRIGAPIAVGQGPVGLALDEAHNRLYVWNHFDATLSAVDTGSNLELARVPVFNPLPAAIRAGRPLLYDTHRTSGLGQVSCGSCHVDARMDRLAWDLGDPAAVTARFDQNCGTSLAPTPCQDFQGMKGPMTTQTLQDIIGHEPFHWRGDRAGIEAFNPAFVGLLGDDTPLTAGEMQAFEDFLRTINFPPNPNRNFDNSLPNHLALVDQYTSGRFAMPGLPLGFGDAVRGLDLYTRNLLDSPFQCASCHTLPTGMAVNGPLMLGAINASSGGTRMALGTMGENHLGIVSVDGSTNVSIKVPQLRNQYEKTGFEMTKTQNRAGFGFLHDGSVDSLSRFISARNFSVHNDQDVADIVALVLSFSGSDFGDANPFLGAPAPLSRDTPAAVGAQLTLSSDAAPARLDEMLALARNGSVDLVVRTADAGYSFDRGGDRFLTNDGSAPRTVTALKALASASAPQTWTLVPAGLGLRLGLDRDGDGVGDATEIRQGSNPADAASNAIRPAAGLWFNPARSGHGMDVEFLGQFMFVTWYTYLADGSPVWYQAAGPYASPWVVELNRFDWNPVTHSVVTTTVGEVRMSFDSARSGSFDWRMGEHHGVEAIQPLIGRGAPMLPDRTGTWFDPQESGWGLSIYTEADVRLAILYFYDGDNRPRWVLGQDQVSSTGTMSLLSFRGFCPDCALVSPTHTDGGRLDFDFSGARTARLTTDAYDAAQPNAHWRRGPVAIVPLSDPALHPDQF